MAKATITFLSNDIESVFDYFKSMEAIESIFNIQYAWEDGSFDSEVGDLDLNTLKFGGEVFREYPLVLSVQYDDDHRVSFSDSFTKPRVKEMTKQAKHQYAMWSLETNAGQLRKGI